MNLFTWRCWGSWKWPKAVRNSTGFWVWKQIFFYLFEHHYIYWECVWMYTFFPQFLFVSHAARYGYFQTMNSKIFRSGFKLHAEFFGLLQLLPPAWPNTHQISQPLHLWFVECLSGLLLVHGGERTWDRSVLVSTSRDRRSLHVTVEENSGSFSNLSSRWLNFHCGHVLNQFFAFM